MSQNVKQIDVNRTPTKAARVPIPLSAEEAKALSQLAKDESRSRQAMAGIIYRLGLKTYAKNAPQHRPRQK